MVRVVDIVGHARLSLVHEPGTDGGDAINLGVEAAETFQTPGVDSFAKRPCLPGTWQELDPFGGRQVSSVRLGVPGANPDIRPPLGTVSKSPPNAISRFLGRHLRSEGHRARGTLTPTGLAGSLPCRPTQWISPVLRSESEESGSELLT